MYLGHRIAQIRVRRTPPEIQQDWMATKILLPSEEGVTIVQAINTQQLNRW